MLLFLYDEYGGGAATANTADDDCCGIFCILNGYVSNFVIL